MPNWNPKQKWGFDKSRQKWSFDKSRLAAEAAFLGVSPSESVAATSAPTDANTFMHPKWPW
jgi:hypothetical protein